MFKRFHFMAAALVASTLSTGFAQSLTYNIGAVSLYKSSGKDQNWTTNYEYKNASPALQGGIDFDAGNGFSVGSWASTGKFGDGHVEIDLYGAYTGSITKELSYELGAATYLYPGAGDDAKYVDVSVGLNFNMFSVKYAYGVSDKNYKDQARLSFKVKHEVMPKLTLEAGVGVRNKKRDNGSTDYLVGVNYDLGDSLIASANLSAGQNAADKMGDSGKPRFIVGINKTFKLK